MRANSFVVALILAIVMVMTSVHAMPLACDDSMTHDYALQSQLDLMSGAAVSKDELDIKARDNTTSMASTVALTCLQGSIQGKDASYQAWHMDLKQVVLTRVCPANDKDGGWSGDSCGADGQLRDVVQPTVPTPVTFYVNKADGTISWVPADADGGDMCNVKRSVLLQLQHATMQTQQATVQASFAAHKTDKKVKHFAKFNRDGHLEESKLFELVMTPSQQHSQLTGMSAAAFTVMRRQTTDVARVSRDDINTKLFAVGGPAAVEARPVAEAVCATTMPMLNAISRDMSGCDVNMNNWVRQLLQIAGQDKVLRQSDLFNKVVKCLAREDRADVKDKLALFVADRMNQSPLASLSLLRLIGGAQAQKLITKVLLSSSSSDDQLATALFEAMELSMPSEELAAAVERLTAHPSKRISSAAWLAIADIERTRMLNGADKSVVRERLVAKVQGIASEPLRLHVLENGGDIFPVSHVQSALNSLKVNVKVAAVKALRRRSVVDLETSQLLQSITSDASHEMPVRQTAAKILSVRRGATVGDNTVSFEPPVDLQWKREVKAAKELGPKEMHLSASLDGLIGYTYKGCDDKSQERTFAYGAAAIAEVKATVFGDQHDMFIFDLEEFGATNSPNFKDYLKIVVIDKVKYSGPVWDSDDRGCWNLYKLLWSFPTTTVFQFSYPFSIGPVPVSVGLGISLTADLYGNLTVCPNQLFAYAGAKPTVRVDLTGSAAVGISKVKGEIDVVGSASGGVVPAFHIDAKKCPVEACPTVDAFLNPLRVSVDAQLKFFTKHWSKNLWHYITNNVETYPLVKC